MPDWLLWLAQDATPEPVELAWPVIAGGAAAVCTVLAFLLAAARFAWVRLGRPTTEFLADWRGEDARPGFAGRPGMPERMTRIEGTQTEILGRLGRVEAELTTNGGSSMRDQVGALARQAGVGGGGQQ